MIKLTKKWAILLCALLPMTMMAQDKKSFTLDDLMWGGSNYYNIMPRSIHTAWWGDCLLQTDVEEIYQLYDEKGKIL